MRKVVKHLHDLSFGNFFLWLLQWVKFLAQVKHVEDLSVLLITSQEVICKMSGEVLTEAKRELVKADPLLCVGVCELKPHSMSPKSLKSQQSIVTGN